MSNFSGIITSESYGWQVEVFVAIALPIQIAAVALRLYARGKVVARFGWDDALCLLSLVCQITLAGLCIAAVEQGGIGYEVAYLARTDPSRLIVLRKYMLITSVFYFATLNIPKLAILVLFHRLFVVKYMKYINYAIGVVLLGQTFGTTIADLLACQATGASSSVSSTGHGSCSPVKTSLYVWSSIPSIVTDVAMLLYPLPWIWKLHTSPREKVGLVATFAVGSIGLIAAILRFDGFLHNASNGDTFNGVGLLNWSVAEPACYLLSACLPTYRPLLKGWNPGRFKSKWASKESSQDWSSNAFHVSNTSGQSRSTPPPVPPKYALADNYFGRMRQDHPTLPANSWKAPDRRGFVELGRSDRHPSSDWSQV